MNLREEQAAMRERQRRSPKRGNKKAEDKKPPSKTGEGVTDAK
jgi:hypothetical protein